MAILKRVVLEVNAGVLSVGESFDNVALGFTLDNIIHDGTKYLAYGNQNTSGEGCSGVELGVAIYRAEGASAISFASDTYIHKYGNDPCGNYKRAHAANIVKVGAVYYMYHEDYYENYAGQWSGFISRLDSNDGSAWSNDGAVLVPTSDWQACHTEYPQVIYEGGVYHMWYMAGTALPYFYSLGYANSTNGTTFINRTRLLDESVNYIDENNAEWCSMQYSAIFEEGGIYFFIYNKDNDLYYRTSTDKINWEHKGKLLGNEAVEASGTLDVQNVFKDTDTTLYLYFSYSGSLKVLSDTISLSEARVCAFSKVLTDVLSLSETIAKKFARTLSDSISLVDGVSRKPMKVLSDILTLSEVIVKKVKKRLADRVWLAEIIDTFLDVKGVLWNLRDRVLDKIDWHDGKLATKVKHKLTRIIDKVKWHE